MKESARSSSGAAVILHGGSCLSPAVAACDSVSLAACHCSALVCAFALLFAAVLVVLEYILHLLSHFLLPPR